MDMSHLVAVEVLAEPPLSIVSVTGYRELEQPVFADGKPVFDGEGNPVVEKILVADTADVYKGGTANLDPNETRIELLVQAGLVRILPVKGKK